MSLSKKDKISYIFFQCAVVLIYCAILVFPPIYYLFIRKSTAAPILPFSIYFLILIVLYFIRYFIALFYKDKEIDNDFEPTAAVIIPVKNEEAVIYQTIKLCYENDYPTKKLDVIVIDDGSTDKTLNEIRRAKKDFPSLKYKSYETNRGKRLAITSALELTAAEFIVMLDSDTLLERGAIRQLLQQFKDEKVAAASGHTKVANISENWLTKAQAFKYYCSYRLFKAFEGFFGTVVCAPGCFSAYRATKLLSIIDKWNKKTFFGRRCIAGEDRALTTLLLKENKIAYSDKAVAYTYVPTTLKAFTIQQKRWMRSWFRESLYVARFMWRKSPLPALCFYILLFISMFAPITLVREALIMPFILGRFPLFYFGALLFIIFTQAFFTILTKKKGYFFYGFVFSFVYFIFLVWLIPVAIFTVTSGNWGSRGASYDVIANSTPKVREESDNLKNKAKTKATSATKTAKNDKKSETKSKKTPISDKPTKKATKTDKNSTKATKSTKNAQSKAKVEDKSQKAKKSATKNAKSAKSAASDKKERKVLAKKSK